MKTLLWFHYHSQNDNTAQWLQLLAIVVAIITFFWNLRNQDRIRKQDKLESLNNDFFTACEAIIRCVNHANNYVLEARYSYALYALNIERSHNERFYFKFYDEAEAYRMKVVMYQIDLIKLRQDFIKYGKKEDSDKINELLSKYEYSFINSEYDGCFIGLNQKQAEAKYLELKKNVKRFVRTQTICKNLILIQRIVHPDYPNIEELDAANAAKEAKNHNK